MKKLDSINLFLNKYFPLIFCFFALLTLLPYVKFFSFLQVGYTAGLIYRGILFVIICIVLIAIIITNKFKLPYYFYLFILLYFLSQILTIFISPYIHNVSLTPLLTVMGLAEASAVSLSTLAYLKSTKYDRFSPKLVNILCLIYIFIGIALCLYTYIFEYSDIYNTFTKSDGWNYDVTSIFIDKTTYGYTLFVCSTFSLIYSFNNKKPLMVLVSFFFLLNMFLSRSKTSILCTLIIIVPIVLFFCRCGWKKHKKFLLGSFFSTLLFSSIILSLTLANIGPFSRLNYFISYVIFNDGIVVMVDRIEKWEKLLESLNNPYNLIFGYGERITPYVLSKCGCASIGDSIYITNIGVGGLIKFSLYLLLIIFIFFINIKNESHINKIIIIPILIAILVGGLFEDDNIIGINISSLFSSLLYINCNKILREND